VDIVVSVVSADPPVGHVTTAAGGTPTAFVGWLGLLRLLADAVGDEPVSPCSPAPSSAPSSRGERGRAIALRAGILREPDGRGGDTPIGDR
jgi:hypothetical protein